MSSACITYCVKDACGDPRIPVRATYVNLYKWPESDAEFVRSVSSRMSRGGGGSGGGGGSAVRHGHPRVVDSISCRQMYLRSYPFCKEEEVPEKSWWFGKFGKKKKKKKKKTKRKGERDSSRDRDRDQERRCMELKRVKEVSWKALFRLFHRLLSCSASVDVADHHRKDL